MPIMPSAYCPAATCLLQRSTYISHQSQPVSETSAALERWRITVAVEGPRHADESPNARETTGKHGSRSQMAADPCSWSSKRRPAQELPYPHNSPPARRVQRLALVRAVRLCDLALSLLRHCLVWSQLQATESDDGELMNLSKAHPWGRSLLIARLAASRFAPSAPSAWVIESEIAPAWWGTVR